MLATAKRTLAGVAIAGFGAVATLWLIALGPGTATAYADLAYHPVGHGTWCPGDRPVANPGPGSRLGHEHLP